MKGMLMIQKPNLIQGGKFVDDRGTLTFWNAWDMLGIRRAYQVQNHRAGFIRAFHGHEREEKFVCVSQGAALVILTPLYTLDTIETVPPVLTKFVLSSEAPAILHIPAGYYNGFKTLTDNTTLTFYSTSTVEESQGDDIRQPWDVFGKEIWQENYR
jgi:dTDP-4-dehydrorhamnose 3,5-epimerase